MIKARGDILPLSVLNANLWIKLCLDVVRVLGVGGFVEWSVKAVFGGFQQIFIETARVKDLTATSNTI